MRDTFLVFSELTIILKPNLKKYQSEYTDKILLEPVKMVLK